MAKPAFDPSKPFEAVKPPFDPSKPFSIVEEAPGPAIEEKVETGIRSAIEGATGGLSEPVIGGINAFVGNLIEAGFDAESIGEFAKKAVSAEALKQQYSKDIARRRKLEAELPEIAIPSEIGGAVAGGLVTGGATAAPKAIQAATVLPRLAMGAGEVAAKMVPTAIGQAAAKGAVSAASAEALKAAAQVPTGVMAPQEIAIKEAALLGGGLGAGAQAVVSGVKSIPGVAKKVVSALGGVREEGITAYLKDPAAVVRAQSPEVIKASIDEQVGMLNRAIENGDVAISDAKKAIEKTEEALAQEVNKRSTEFAKAKFDAKQYLAGKKQEFNEAVKVAQKTTESAMTAGKQILRDDAVNAVGALKDQVIEGSKQSYKILERSGRQIDTAIPLQVAKEQLEALKVQGKAPVTGAAAAAYKQIEQYVDDLGRFKKPLNASEAKKKIQQLDNDARFLMDQGEFGTDLNNALIAIRRGFDQQLKDIPEYAEIMARVSDDTALLGQANKLFGNVERAQSKIARIENPEQDLSRQVLFQLGQRTQRNFENQVELLKGAEARLAPGVIPEQMRVSPTGMELTKAETAVEAMQRPGVLEDILAPIRAESPQALAARQAQEQMVRAQNIAAAAEKNLKDLGPFARPASNINAIRTALSGRNPEYTRYLENLTKLSGEDFVRAIDDLKIAEQFGKSFQIGSRNVNLWALGAGGAMYGITGDPTVSLAVAGLGGGFGSMVDRFGPKMTQKVLDAYLKVEGLPTVQKINKAFAGLPVEIIEQIKNDFIRTLPVATGEQVQVPPDQAASLLRDIKASDLSTIKKAEMIKEMSANGSLNSNDVAAVMIGKRAKPTRVMVPEKKADLNMDKPDVLRNLAKPRQ